MRIKTILRMTNGIILAISLLLLLSLVWAFRETVKANNNESFVINMQRLAYQSAELRDEYLFRHEERARSQWTAKTEQFKQLLAAAGGRFANISDKAILEDISREFSATVFRFSELVEYRKKNRDAKSQYRDIGESRLISQLIVDAYNLNSSIDKLRTSTNQASDLAQGKVAVIIIVLLIITVLISSGNYVFISNIVTRRLKELQKGAEAIGAGDFDYRIPIAGNDEFTYLSMTTNAMAEKLNQSYTSLENLQKEIAERRSAEAALQQAEQNFRNSLDDSMMGVRIVSAAGATLYANRAVLDIYGYAGIDELKAIPVTERYTPESQDGHWLRKEQRKGGDDGPSEYEVSIVRRDGKVRHLRVFRKEIIWDAARHFQVIYQDITAGKQAEQALRRSEKLREALFDSAKDFIFIKDLNRRYLLVNNFFQRIFAVDPEIFIGKTDPEIPIFENKEDTGSIISDMDSRVLQGETVGYQMTHRIRGTEITFDIIKTPLRDEKGNVTGICGLSRDVTERKRLEEERKVLEERLQRSEKMEALGTLAGGVAHDLNNVLGIVVGYSEMLLDGLEEASPIRSDVMHIMQGGERAAAIVQDLLTLARRGVQTKKVVNLNTAIMACRQTPEFEKIISFSRRIRLHTDLNTDLMNIMGSPVHISKSIINLISNAVEAMPEGGLLKITTANQYLDRPIQGYDHVREGDYVVLSVSDTGEGIAANDIKRIFEPFYTKKVMGRSGTGLGLAVVWGTVKDHNGYIDVQSEMGKGTTFTLYFPVTREDLSQEQLSPSLSEYVGKEESLLVVDDVKGQRELATRMLARLNYRVTSVSSGEEAVAYLKSNKVDLVVLDMIMDPGMDGLDTYRKIIEIQPGQKAIVVSGFSESERVKKAQALGAGPYVKKPYILERLGLAVRKELDRKSATAI